METTQRFVIKMMEDLDDWEREDGVVTDEPTVTTWSAKGEQKEAVEALRKMLAYWPEKYVCGWVYDTELNCRCSPVYRAG